MSSPATSVARPRPTAPPSGVKTRRSAQETPALPPTTGSSFVMLAADGKLHPVGTVVSITDGGLSVAPASRSYDRRVLGVVVEALHDEEDRALVRIGGSGIVQIRVGLEAGQIAPGDLLVASNRPGIAVRARDPYRAIGAIVAKALEPVRWHDAPHGAERLVKGLVMR